MPRVSDEETTNKSLTNLAKILGKLKDDKKRTEENLTRINKAIIKIEQVDLPKLMDDNEIEKFNVAGLGVVFLTDEVYVSVLKDDREKLYAWLRAKGHGPMVTDWVFPQSFQAFVKRQLKDQAEFGVNDGNQIPEFVKVTQVSEANLRGKK